MLRRTHIEPFLRERDGTIEAVFLAADGEGRVVALLDHLCRLARRLEGRPRRVVSEALRRQERRVRDARRLAGISKTLLDLCEFRPPPGAERAAEVRAELFRARGELWPPTPGDARQPYARAAAALGLEATELDRLLYADSPTAHVLTRAPAVDGRALLDRYNLDLARGVLLDAERMVVTARGGWRGIFRAVKLARLMYRIERAGRRRYTVELTGPASPFVTRTQRYGARFVRVVPALARAPGWGLEAEIVRGSGRSRYVLDGRAPVGRTAHRSRYDSRWERALAREFGEKLGTERKGWSLAREDTPLALGGELFLPDFTLRHADGREALIEIVGYSTPEYLERKLAKVAAAGLEHLVLVVYRGLAAGPVDAAAAGPVLWFANRPRIGPVLQAAERVARVPSHAGTRENA